jgi:DHA1 family bicyclomycin/chloramphenicol resistance-like MFS transporter
MKNSYILLFMLILISILGLFSSDVYLPAFPIIKEYFNVEENLIHQSLSFFLLGLSLSQIFYGTLSDALGRKPVLICGMFVYATSSIALTLAQNIEFLILCRFFQGIGAASGMVLARAIIADSFPKEKVGQTIATIFIFVGASPAIAPVFGGFLTTYISWQANFFLLALIGGIALLLSIFFYKETIKTKTKISLRNILQSYLTLISSSLFVRYVLIIACASGLYFAFLASSPFMFAKLGYKTHEMGFFYTLLAIFYMMGNSFGKKIVVKIGMQKAIRLGAIITFIGSIAILISSLKNMQSLLLILIPICLVTFGNGIIMPFGFASSITLIPNLAGSASGLAGLIQMGGASFGATMIAVFYAKNISAMPFIAVLLASIILISITSIIYFKKI